MRVPSLAALAVICAACADGNPAITSLPQPSLALVRGADASKIARCTFRKPQVTLRAGTGAEVGIDCRDRSGRYLGEIDARTANYASANARIASVSQDGHISARGAGSTLIRATHARYPFQDSIRVVVTGSIVKPGPTPNPRPNPSPTPKPKPAPQPAPAPTPPPPTGPPAPTAGFPNQPAGFIFITDRDFDSKARNNDDRGPGGSDGWDGIEYRYPNFRIVNDPSAPNGDGKVGEMFYSAGMRSGTGPATAHLYFPRGLRQIYLSIWARLSPNWVGNQSSTNKMFFV
ncbi:MAG TPA: hypothetical protein VK922_06630, partial [Gemmatimonadaceae bacterium]|nr:hypothetical protein [Gemmatimonadaceae bacterium]